LKATTACIDSEYDIHNNEDDNDCEYVVHNNEHDNSINNQQQPANEQSTEMNYRTADRDWLNFTIHTQSTKTDDRPPIQLKRTNGPLIQLILIKQPTETDDGPANSIETDERSADSIHSANG
jgi:hypothetical protein